MSSLRILLDNIPGINACHNILILLCILLNGIFYSTIDNIANLVKAISRIRDISLENLRAARDFEVSSICTRQFISSIACQHCQGSDTRACPKSCRIVSFLCLQPLRQAFTDSYEAFIM